jgi:hypothetical protein
MVFGWAATVKKNRLVAEPSGAVTVTPTWELPVTVG